MSDAPDPVPFHVDLFHQAVAAHQAGALDEAERLYRAVIAADPAARAARSNLATVHFHRGDFEGAIAWLDQLLSIDPRRPDVLNNRANAQANLGRFDLAAADCEAALVIDPGYLDAAQTRAWALQAQGRRTEALAAYAFILAAVDDPRDAQTWAYRGKALQGLDRDEEALACLDRAAALRPYDADLPYLRGLSLTKLKRLDAAMAAYETAIALRPAFASAHWNRGGLLLASGRPQEGWPLYEWRWRDPALAAGAASFSPAPVWLGETPLAGKTLLVQHEQGLGDTLQMLRYMPLLRAAGARTVLAVQPQLAPLLKPLADEILLPGGVIPAHDLRTFTLSLPMALGAASGAPPPDAPYLQAPPDAITRWRDRLGSRIRPKARLRVGLAWSGDPRHVNDHNRSLPLTALLPWLSADADFHALQAHYRPTDQAVLDGEPRLHDHAALLTDFGETAALVADMDLVIAVDTSIAHLAGALGKPLWLLLPWVPDHRWGWEAERTPWYPTARLWRQPAAGDWDSVTSDVARALTTL